MPPLPIFVDIALALIFLLVGVLYGRRIFRGGMRLAASDAPQKARILVSIAMIFVFGNVAAAALKNYPAIAWYLPPPVEYGLLPLGWGIDVPMMSFTLAAIVTVAFLERHRARWLLAALGITALVAADSAFHHSAFAMIPRLREPHVVDGIIRQTNNSTCAAATCANIARRLGKDADESSMVALLGTTEDGTSPAQMIYGLRRIGLHAKKRYLHNRDATKLAAPAVLLMPVGGEEDAHAIAYMGQADGMMQLWDPVAGLRPMTKEELAVIWPGRALEISK